MTRLRIFAVLPALMFAFFGFGGATLAQESESDATALDETVEGVSPTLPAFDAASDIFAFDGATGDIAIFQDNVIFILVNANIGNIPPVAEDAVDDGSEGSVDDGTEDGVEGGSGDAVDDGTEDAVEDGSEDAVEDGDEATDEGDATEDGDGAVDGGEVAEDGEAVDEGEVVEDEDEAADDSDAVGEWRRAG